MKTEQFYRDKTVLVTGGAAGIGRGLCELLCASGAIVYAADINEEGLQELINQAPSGGKITALRLDVSNQHDFQTAIERVVKEQTRLDVLINNAGIVLGGDFNDTTMEDIERIINVNLWSVIYGTKIAYTQMRKQGHGHIANISSSAGMMPVPYSTMYAAIKHATLGFSHSLREEAAQYDVEISVALPGMVQSGLWDNAVNVKDYNYKERMESTGIKPISAEAAATEILRGISTNKRSTIFPRLNRVILRLYQLMPNLMTQLTVKPLAKSRL